MTWSRIVLVGCAGVALGVAAPSAALAQASGDGWQGPMVVSGSALDETLLATNEFLQARYKSDDIMASLQDPAPLRDFAAVAVAVGDAPELASLRVDPGFGPAVGDSRSLDLQLASFNADLDRRGEELFVRVARAAGGTALDFAEVAEVPPLPGDELAFGPEIWSDVTLDAHMLAFYDHMIEQSARNTLLSVAEGTANAGSSFDRYGESLTLY